jgi:hypothetical protein
MSNLSKGQFRSVLLSTLRGTVHTLFHSTDSRYIFKPLLEGTALPSSDPEVGTASLSLVLDRMLLEAVTLLPRVNSSST